MLAVARDENVGGNPEKENGDADGYARDPMLWPNGEFRGPAYETHGGQDDDTQRCLPGRLYGQAGKHRQEKEKDRKRRYVSR